MTVPTTLVSIGVPDEERGVLHENQLVMAVWIRAGVYDVDAGRGEE